MTKAIKQTECSSTWMLFESGSGVTVELSLHEPPREKNRPIDAYVVTECEGNFTGSARRAAEAVYDVARKSRAEPPPVVVGYDLHGLPSGMPVIGESGGLAFAIALAKRLFDKDPGPVAASGEVKSGHGGGPVGPVEGIEAKLEAAGRLLPEQGWVFYPKDNDRGLSEKLRQSLKDRGLKIRPVSSVAEALDELFDLTGSGTQAVARSENRLHRIMMGVLFLILLGGAAGAALWINDWRFSWPDNIHKYMKPAHGDAPPEPVTKKAKNDLPHVGNGVKIHNNPLPDPIDIVGETRLAADLAHLLTEALEGSLKEDHGFDSQQMRLSGRVVILQVKEDPMKKKEGFYSGVTASVTGLVCNGPEGTISYSAPRVNVNGEGSAMSLLPRVASDLTEEIVRMISDERAENKKTAFGDTGFE